MSASAFALLPVSSSPTACSSSVLLLRSCQSGSAGGGTKLPPWLFAFLPLPLVPLVLGPAPSLAPLVDFVGDMEGGASAGISLYSLTPAVCLLTCIRSHNHSLAQPPVRMGLTRIHLLVHVTNSQSFARAQPSLCNEAQMGVFKVVSADTSWCQFMYKVAQGRQSFCTVHKIHSHIHIGRRISGSI